MNRPLFLRPVVLVALICGLIVAGFTALNGNASEQSAVAAQCTEPATPDRDATEQYAACRAAEVAAVLTNLPPVPTQTVTATETVTATATATTTVTASPTPTPTPTPTPEPAKKIIGMSASASLWSQRLSEVGPCGVEARRIFADLTSTGRSQSTTIEQAVAAGMIPVISWKVPSVTTLLAGGYDSWLTNLNAYLASLQVPVMGTFWHEPRGDMTAAQFRAGSQKFLDFLTAPNVSVGPLLNGFLLDTANGRTEFATYTSPALLDQWAFLGVDSYQQGDRDNPSTWGNGPDRTVPLLEQWLDDQGHPDMPISFGEWNTYTGSEMAEMGEALLSTPEVWFALVFNSDVGAKGMPLTGDRLTAYQATKADARALHDPPC